MDKTTEKLVTYATEFSESVLSESVKDAALRHLVDTVAVMIVGSTSPSAKVATRLARSIRTDPGATVVGSDRYCLPDLAAFANTTMVRAWDWQDGMYASAGGQPSQMVPAILAVGEVIGSSPQEVLVAMVLAYELLGALGSTIPMDLRWGQITFMAPSAVLAVGKLLKLNFDQLVNAVLFSMCPGVGSNVGMRQAIFAAQMAKEGMTGAIDRSRVSLSKEPFEDQRGLWAKLHAEQVRTELSLPAIPGGPMVVEMSYMKQFPAELHSQVLIALIPKIRSWTSIEEIESIEIQAYRHLVNSLATSPSTWDPKDELEAGLSLPYMMSVALVDGELTPAQFSPERFTDPSLRPLMKKFTIRENEGFTAQFRPPGLELIGNPRVQITVRKRSGEELHEEVTFPKGHMLNPMNADDVNTKLDTACAGVIGDERKELIRSAWWNVEKATKISDVITTLANF